MSEKNSQKPKIIGFFEKIGKIECFFILKIQKVIFRWCKGNLENLDIPFCIFLYYKYVLSELDKPNLSVRYTLLLPVGCRK